MSATTIVWQGLDAPRLEVGDGRIRFTSGSFIADIYFDDHGFVSRYEGLAERLA